MKRKGIVKKLICLCLAIVLCCALCACSPWRLYVNYVNTSGTGVPTLFGKVVLEIQTDSMYPTLSAGDVIFCDKVTDPSTLRIGDIITYWTVINGERVLNTHRIVEIYDGGDYLIFATKGDNNTEMDALTVHESEIVAVYKK